MKNIYLAGGCFWCISGTFINREGIIDVISGYSGGKEENPKYEDENRLLSGNKKATINLGIKSKIFYYYKH